MCLNSMEKKYDIEHWIDIKNNAVISIKLYIDKYCTCPPILETIFIFEDGKYWQLFLWGSTIFHLLYFHLSVCDILFLYLLELSLIFSSNITNAFIC